MRGYNKKVFLLKETDSYIFDEALFFVKRDVETSTLGKSDMVIEANRIIEESLREDFDLPRGEGVSFLKRSLIPAVQSERSADLRSCKADQRSVPPAVSARRKRQTAPSPADNPGWKEQSATTPPSPEY